MFAVSVAGKFLPGDETSLVVWKGNRLEVFAAGEEGLVSVAECRLFGSVEAALLLRSSSSSSSSSGCDRLFVLTAEHQLLVLAVSAAHVIEEAATGAVRDAAGEPAAPLAVAGDKMIALILNEGMLKAKRKKKK